MKNHTRRITLLSAVLLVFFLAGCDATDANEADTGASADVARSVATLVSEETGGLLDQAGDVFELATAGDIDAQAAKLADANQIAGVEKSYDDATGTWTISVDRFFESPDGLRQAQMTKLYEVQFLNVDGVPQQFFVTDEDTAHTIAFTIVEGSGSLQTPHLTAERTGITGAWVATGVNTDVVTVNGTYSRSGAHTLTTENAERTLDYDLAVEVVDLVGPKGSRRDLTQKLSGTITGTYDAFATFTRGDLYREREIARNVRIEIDNGTLTITVNGEPFTGSAGTGTLGGK